MHDHLDRIQIRLFTFLVGQQELLAVKTALQHARKTQIEARLMVEDLAFHGVRNVSDVPTCLAGYDQTSFPRSSNWSFTRFYLRQAVDGGYRLGDDAALLWNAFAALHHKHGLTGELEIPMDSFARAVEIVLKESELRDAANFRPDAAAWNLAVRSCGYRLSVFSIASHQMDYTYELLGLSDHAHVAARFLVAHWPFPGISSADEVEFVLRGYDEASEWPAHSATSYLAHFAPDAFARGARLAHCSGVVWQVLESLLPTHYKGDTEFPMQHIARAVEEILVDVARGAPWESATSRPRWIDVLAQTQFTGHMRLISAAVQRKRTVQSK